jgi:hypothetical protein
MPVAIGALNGSTEASSDGRVLVAGGLLSNGTGNTFLSTAELYDATNGSFTLTGSLNHAREATAWFSLLGEITVRVVQPDSLAQNFIIRRPARSL